MIKIKPYSEILQREEFLNLYRFLTAKAMPFYPEDLFPEGYFYPDGKTKTDLPYFKRAPRYRTDGYSALFAKYKIPGGDSGPDKARNDAILAEAIIRENSEGLHSFLYHGCINGHVSPEKLQQLLLASVGPGALQKLPFLDQALQAGKDRKDDLLKNVFRYDIFSRQAGIYHLVFLLGVPVCPYCNRLFITSVEKDNVSTQDPAEMRPQLDHYRNKSEYPFLALSIMNLIPSCGVCNHKKSNDPREILYPYAEGMGDLCSFQVDAERDLTMLTGTGIDEEELTLRFVKKGPTTPLTGRIDASIDLLNLNSLYQSHKRYVSDILMQRYIFTNDMVNEIAAEYDDLFNNNTREVREMLLLGRLDQSHWGDRPLGKLTSDISNELDYLYCYKEEK